MINQIELKYISRTNVELINSLRDKIRTKHATMLHSVCWVPLTELAIEYRISHIDIIRDAFK